MPSKPNWNVVGSDITSASSQETQFDGELPDELRMLGEQLSDDARALAARYSSTPAALPGVDRADRAVSAASWRRIAAAIVLLALGAGGATLAWRPWQSSAQASAGSGHSVSAAQAIDRPTPAVEPTNPAGVQEVSIDPAASGNRSELEMLRVQLSAFEQVIRKLQTELNQRATSEAEMKAVIQSLRDEVGQLRQQLDEHHQPTSGK